MYYSNLTAFNSGIANIDANITEITPLTRDTPAFWAISVHVAGPESPSI